MLASTIPKSADAPNSRAVQGCRHGRRQAIRITADTASRHQATDAAGSTANSPTASAAP